MVALNGKTVHAIVQEGGKITISNLPLRAGEQVEVLVFPMRSAHQPEQLKAKLRGSVVRDDDPFGPATSPDDWDALR